MKKLIVTGCSVTHGTELVDNYSPENIRLSYSQVIADKLNCDLVNVALPGGSNEYIFHSALECLSKYSDIHSLIVAWTFPDRLHWYYGGRHWFFNPSWGSTSRRLSNNMHVKKINGVTITSDIECYLDTVELQHRILVDHYFTDNNLTTDHLNEKTKHYSQALSAVCHSRQIQLIEVDAAMNYFLDVFRFESLGLSYIREQRHPNKEEHRIIAEKILETYYGGIAQLGEQ